MKFSHKELLYRVRRGYKFDGTFYDFFPIKVVQSTILSALKFWLNGFRKSLKTVEIFI